VLERTVLCLVSDTLGPRGYYVCGNSLIPAAPILTPLDTVLKVEINYAAVR
jgi:hypothetical protein